MISAHFANLHRARGTEILTGRVPERFDTRAAAAVA